MVALSSGVLLGDAARVKAAAARAPPAVRCALPFGRGAPSRAEFSGRAPTSDVKCFAGLSRDCKRNARSPSRLFSTALVDSGGGNLGGGRTDSKPTAEEPDDNTGEPTDEAILAKAENGDIHLPHDMQEALARQACSPADIRQWLGLSKVPLLGWLCRMAPALRDRVMGNPRFLLALAVEEIIGVSAKTMAEYNVRREKFWKEIDFVASDLALEVIGNFSIVWLLSPKKRFRPLPSGRIAKSIAALPSHALQVGDFALQQRLAAIVYKAGQFFSVGFASSVLGHSLTVYIVERKRSARQATALLAAAYASQTADAGKGARALAASDPVIEEAEKELAPVLDNSLGWGSFMVVSSNFRYQLVNGFEERVIDAFVPAGVLRSVASVLTRFANTFVGGAQWMWYAKRIGLQ